MVSAVKMAVEDFGGKVLGRPIEVLSANYQNKVDISAARAREWYDRDDVKVIIESTDSASALAMQKIAREKKRLVIFSGSASSALTNAECSPYGVHYTYDTYAMAHGTGAAITKAGGNSWYFITADYAFGHALEKDTAEVVVANGGKVLGSVRAPLNSPDFSSYLLQAQASKAKVIGLANAGTDTTNCVKQAAEFGLNRRGIKLASLLLFLTEVHSLGLNTANGLIVTESFYWDLNDRTRAFTQRLRQQIGPAPGIASTHAGAYGGALHYLKAVQDMGVAAAKASGADAVARMKALPTDDDAFGPGSIRADGRKIHPSFLFEVKAPAESKGPWDYYKLLQTTPADRAFRPLADGGCPLIKS